MYKKNSSNSSNENKNNKFKEASDETKFERSDDKGSRSKRSNYRRKGNNQRRGNAKERGAESERRSSMDDYVDSTRSGSYVNDPSWYIPDPSLRESLAQWSFSQVAGEDLVANNGDVAKYPSIMKMKLEPSPEPSDVNVKGGFSKYNYKYSGLNAASRNLYNAMSSLTGRTSAYTPDDISILLLGMGEVISMFAFVRTIMHIPYMINLKNKTIPDCLCKAFGIDPVDLRRNIANYRSQYNTLVTQAQNIILPGNIPYFLKCNEIYSHIYADSEADTAQMYIFSPRTTWLLEEKTATTGSKLVTTNAEDGFVGRNLSYYLDLIADMISRFQTSSTYNIVGQDLLHLNSKTNMPLYGYNYLPEFESMQVEYNENALLQIHNLSVNPMYNVVAYDDELGFTPKNDVVGNVETATIFYNPAYLFDADKGSVEGFNEGNIWMDSLVATPTADMRVDATRYTQWIDKTYHHTASNKNYVQFGSGDHRCVSLEIFAASKNNLTPLPTPLTVLYHSWEVMPVASFSHNVFNALAYYMAFDWAPFVMYHIGESYEKVDSTQFMGELNYPTPINVETMRSLNRMAEQFLFTPGKLVDKK